MSDAATYWLVGAAVIALMLLWLVLRVSHVAPEQRARDRYGLGHLCAWCDEAETPDDPLEVDTEGFRVHQSQTCDPVNPLYGTRR